MKKIIVFLFLFFNLLPVIEKGKLALGGPAGSYAQTNGEEDYDYWDDYMDEYWNDYGDITFDDDIAYSIELPEVVITAGSNDDIAMSLTLPAVYITASGSSDFFDSFDFSGMGMAFDPIDFYSYDMHLLPEVTITATMPNSTDHLLMFYDIIDSYNRNFYDQWWNQYTGDPMYTPPPPPDPPVPLSPKDPCNAAAKTKGTEAYSIYSNSAFTSALTTLTSHAINSANEHGFTMNYSNGTYSASSIVEGSSGGVGLTTSSNSVATIHTHPSGSGPSPADVYNLGKNGTPDKAFTIGSDGAVYAIIITDVGKFTAFKSAYPESTNISGGDFSNNSTLQTSFNDLRSGLRDNYSAGDASAGALGSILLGKDAGVSVYKLEGGKLKALGSKTTPNLGNNSTDFNLVKCN